MLSQELETARETASWLIFEEFSGYLARTFLGHPTLKFLEELRLRLNSVGQVELSLEEQANFVPELVNNVPIASQATVAHLASWLVHVLRQLEVQKYGDLTVCNKFAESLADYYTESRLLNLYLREGTGKGITETKNFLKDRLGSQLALDLFLENPDLTTNDAQALAGPLN